MRIDGSLLANARAVGATLEDTLAGWKERYPCVGDARGLGPMRAIELVCDRATKEPFREAAGRLTRYCYEHGVIVLTAGTYGNVIRLLVPLVVTAAELKEGLDIIEAGLQTIAKP